jgi:hypothetical protein
VRLTLADWRLLARLTMASYVIAAVNFMTADTDTDPIAASAVRKAKTGCARSTRTPWPGTTGSGQTA